MSCINPDVLRPIAIYAVEIEMLGVMEKLRVSTGPNLIRLRLAGTSGKASVNLEFPDIAFFDIGAACAERVCGHIDIAPLEDWHQ